MSDFLSGTLFGMFSGVIIGFNLAVLLINNLDKFRFKGKNKKTSNERVLK